MLAKVGSKLTPNWSSMVPSWLNLIPSRPQDCIKSDFLNNTQKPMENSDFSCFLWLVWDQDGAHQRQVGTNLGELGPTLVQVGPKLVQVGPKLTQVGFKLAQVGAKTAQVGAKLAQDERFEDPGGGTGRVAPRRLQGGSLGDAPKMHWCTRCSSLRSTSYYARGY